MSVVIKVDPSTLKKIQQHYGSVGTLPPGAVFRNKTNGVTITGYKSGKVMFQGQNEDREAKRWSNTAPSTGASSQPKLAGSNGNLPVGLAGMSVLGSDEVGTGSYFGPLTAAATYVSAENIAQVKALGIADSKTLTDKAMQTMAESLITFIPYHVVNILPKKYNELNQRLNANEMKAFAHNLALGKVLEKIRPVQPDAILIDQFTQPNTYWKYLRNVDGVVKQNVYFTTKGEQYHLAVAAASVIARYVELQTMATLSDQAGINLPVGAGSAVDKVAAQLLKNGQDLHDYTKYHFANTDKAIALARR
ncbi:ribonuclease HIII [Periweissella cryptocerci]|uniref:Ribonuclease HIII n=1 Tax=Periweissella cryptocerci TaxID=2506420 RepID=A0A4P6YW96_9LACO|nr:ribonuclease HIII [Periweissella cryptocerci]QBO37017.1 ribonuclease HIII [Periweissella cryptocerci]